jgi:hypothetical protein
MKKKIFFFCLILIAINPVSTNAQEKIYGHSPLNFTVGCTPWISDFAPFPPEIYLGQDIVFLVTFSNCKSPVNATSNISIYKNEKIATVIKVYGLVEAYENATIVSSWTPSEVGNYIASAQVIYNGNITWPVNASFKVISLPPVAPPVVVPPIVLPPLLPTPAISVDAPKEILLYVNETGSFIIFVKNIGNVDLFNFSVNFSPLSNISIDITPPFFSKLGVNETKSFSVKILSTEVGEKNGTYYMKSDKISVEKNIKIITRERTPAINATEFKLNVGALEEMINSTHRILVIMYAHGYPVAKMILKLNNASSYLNQSLYAFFEEKYDLAQSLFSQAYSLTQETINETYKIAKGRETVYHAWEKYLILLAIVVLITISILLISFLKYKT